MAEGICSKLGSGCGGQYTARGLCYRHYREALRSGELQSQRGTLAERFWRKVNKDGPVNERRPELGPCWLWTAARDRKGYGVFCTKAQGVTKTYRAHRVAYELLIGLIPAWSEGLDHLCRVRHCVRPAHLEPVTHAENLRRGAGGLISDLRPRRRRPPGETYGQPKLTEAEVRYIRASDLSGNWLAQCMGVAPTTISYVRNRRTWKNV